MDDLYPRIISFVREQPWALMPEKHTILVDILKFRNAGGRLTKEEVQSRIGVKAERTREQRYDPDTDTTYEERFDWETGQSLGFRSQGGEPMRAKQKVIAVIGIHGLISQRAAQVDDISGPGGTSTERLTARFRSALNDSSVTAIVFDVDSPGGGVYGVQELAEEIRGARGQKPIGAVANSLAASAAYWLFAQVDPGEASVTPSGEVGSVGVYAAHEDLSKMLEKDGVKVTLVSSGKFKVEGNPFEPLTEEARVAIQGRVDDYYASFTRAVSKGRGVSIEDVRGGFGEGRVMGARQAVEGKMADRVETLDQMIRRIGGRATSTSTTSGAAAEAPEISTCPSPHGASDSADAFAAVRAEVAAALQGLL